MARRQRQALLTLRAGEVFTVGRRALSFQLNPRGARPVLGVHMRGSDARSMRKRVPPEAFWPYVADFARSHPRGLVYVATESEPNAAAARAWNRTGVAAGRVRMQPIRTRVSGGKANFYVHSDQLGVARDALLDIQILARSDYLVHGASAVAEAAIYVNPSLHWRSTHLEFEQRCADSASGTVTTFCSHIL